MEAQIAVRVVAAGLFIIVFGIMHLRHKKQDAEKPWE